MTVEHMLSAETLAAASRVNAYAARRALLAPDGPGPVEVDRPDAMARIARARQAEAPIGDLTAADGEGAATSADRGA